MGWTIASLSAAPIVGIPIVTSFGAVVGWRAALVIAGVLSALTAPLIGRAIPPDTNLRRGRIRLRDVISSYRPLLRHRGTVRLYGATASRSILVISFIAYLGAFLEDEIGLDTQYVGFVFMASGIANVIGNLVGSRRLGRSTRRVVVSAFVLGAGAVATMFSVESIAAVLPLLMIASFSGAVAGLGTTTLLATESRGGTGTTMVLNGSILNFGAAAGAGLGGLLLELGGYEAMAVGMPLFGLAGAVLIAWPNHD
jgi:DHA1 family inner membrane transport protein